MSHNYNFKDVEANILNAVAFKNDYRSDINSKAPAFSTMMPPPNVTGSLHIGHALVITLQDILTRYHRMKGCDTLWQAGVDHAGIATQLVVERQLAAEGKSKDDLGKDEFFKAAMEWKNSSQSNILNQIKKLGASCDFSNIAFTMSESFSKAVNEVFVTLYNDGLIYQDYRLVNWDTKFATALSDLEVIYKEEKGSLYYIKYQLQEDATQFITIATTRPETMFGDVAIAVNPNDERYKQLIGKYAVIPISGKLIQIIADEHSDAALGTGAVKITPAHDFNDFEVGKRHNLPLVIVINQDGTLNDKVPEGYQSLNVKEGRKKLITELESLGLLEKTEDHIMQVPYGDRSDEVIQPLPSNQWFLNAEPLAKLALDAVEKGEVKLYPDNWKNLYFEWLRNIKPWCISRQLWWGHRIPVWYDKDGNLFVANSELQAQEQAQKKHNTSDEIKLTQDSSVLDTWFSSGLWPFVTLGWPDENSSRLAKYYPTSTLVTGFDIIFFWVARMIMLGKYFLKQVPFKEVYLHGLVLDSKGKKMSKTKGNVVDPLFLMSKFGADALRFTLAGYASGGQNIRFSEKNVEISRNFITKLWNAYKFLEHYDCLSSFDEKNFNPSEVKFAVSKWILNKLNNTILDVEKYIKNYQFNEVTNTLYHFAWHNFCDWYLEIAKVFLNESEYLCVKKETQQVLVFVFLNLIKLLHPLMPFFTEYIFSLKKNSLVGDSVNNHQKLYKLAYPKVVDFDNKNYSQDFNLVEDIIKLINTIRSLRSLLRITPKEFVTLEIQTSQEADINWYSTLLQKLARLDKVKFVKSISANSTIEVINPDLIIGLDLHGKFSTKQDLAKLLEDKIILEKELQSISAKLSNSGFISKAPEEVVIEVKNKEQQIRSKLQILTDILK